MGCTCDSKVLTWSGCICGYWKSQQSESCNLLEWYDNTDKHYRCVTRAKWNGGEFHVGPTIQDESKFYIVYYIDANCLQWGSKSVSIANINSRPVDSIRMSLVYWPSLGDAQQAAETYARENS